MREKLISDHCLFFSYKSQKRAANEQGSWGVFRGCIGLWATGCWFARRLHHSSRPPPPGTSVLQVSCFFAQRVTLRNMGVC